MLFEFIRNIWGTIFALLRLLSLAFVFTVNGIHGILFNRNEIVGLTMHATPMSIEKDKVAYIDQLERQNVDLACGMPMVPPEDYQGAPFREDGEFDGDDDDWINEEDFEDDNPDGDNNG